MARRQRCGGCAYLTSKMPEGQTGQDAAEHGTVMDSYFCNNPDFIKKFGDGIHPVPRGVRAKELVNDAYRTTKRNSKWDKTPRELYLTGAPDPVGPTRLRIFDDESDVEEEVENRALPMQAREQEVGKPWEQMNAEEREYVLGIRDTLTSERAYEPKKVNASIYIKSDLWDEGCEFGTPRRGSGRDNTNLGLKNVAKQKAL